MAPKGTFGIRGAIIIGAFFALSLPGLAFAQQGGNNGNGGDSPENVEGAECVNGEHVNNPHCTASEVPFALIYPAVGAASFAAYYAIRRRRQNTQVNA